MKLLRTGKNLKYYFSEENTEKSKKSYKNLPPPNTGSLMSSLFAQIFLSKLNFLDFALNG